MIRPATVTPADTATLDDLDTGEVISTLAADGVVHFRGFDVDVEGFHAFSDRFSDDFTCDPHKVVANSWNGASGTLGRVTRKVTRSVNRLRARRWPVHDAAPARFAPFSGYGLNPHNENCYLPGAFPDLVWFHCSRPAAKGGATILLDGAELLDGLDAPTVEFLRDTPVRYSTTLQRPQWQATWGVDRPAELRARLDGYDGVTHELSPSGQLDVTFDSTQISVSKFGEREVVRSNLLSRQPFQRVAPDKTEQLASGGRVPAEVVSALLEGARKRTELDLEAGDVIVIDNSRVMHGRTPFGDPNRRIETRCAWLRPGLGD